MASEVGFEVHQREDGTVRVRTTGMGRRGRPEIELTEVTPAQVANATDLLSRVAATVSDRAVYPGQVMFVADDLTVQLQESEHLSVGFLARAFGATDRTVMRITDAGRLTAEAALCGTARLRARSLADQGDTLGAARALHEALEATRHHDDVVTGERARASIALSHIETDERRALALLAEGLQTSQSAQLGELAATLEEIRVHDRRRLVTQMRQIASINLGLVEEDEMNNVVRVVPSPLWQRSETEPPRAELGMTMIPGPWLRLYWTGQTRFELETGIIPDLAANIFSSLAKQADGIARMALVVRETEKTFPLSESAPRATASPKLAAPHLFLASRVVAHVARLRTAELTPAEIHAAFGLNKDREAIELARDKGRRLRVRLAQWTRDGRVGRND